MASSKKNSNDLRIGSDAPFYTGMGGLTGGYILLIVLLLLGLMRYVSLENFQNAWQSEEIRYAIKLSLISCTLSTVLSIWVAVPAGYIFSRKRFPGKAFFDAILDIPIVLPPLVIGLGLLIIFTTPLGRVVDSTFHKLFGTTISFAIPGVILAQFMVACAFAVRIMRATFDEISPRCERVALTLGCTQGQAFWHVALPQARGGMIVAASIAWARALGEFGPILIFAGTTRRHTEVLSSTVFLELSVGNINAAATVSLMMVFVALLLLVIVRLCGYYLHPSLRDSR